MKKNFLMVASLLIAAMLMVVSCTQEVAPKNDGLVEAKLNVAYGRELDVQNAANADGLTLKYTMINQWVDNAAEDDADKVYGKVDTPETLRPDGKLGWVSQGYWTITVTAYDQYNNAVFSGNTSVYFNSTRSTATIYLEPVTNSSNKITFNFYMQDLGDAYGPHRDFVVKYSITKNGSALSGHSNVVFADSTEAKKLYKVGGELTTTAPVSNSEDYYDHQRLYEKEISGLDSGYYTVTVSVYEKDNTGELVLKGGISEGMLLAGNQATVSGHVEPSDYVGTQLTTYYVDVDTVLEKATSPVELAENKKSATIKLKFTDNTDVKKYYKNLDVSSFGKSYFVSVNGKPFENLEDEKNTVTLKSVFNKDIVVTSNGVNNIAVRTIYSYKVGDKTYFWAETKDVSVQVTGIDY